MVKGKWFDDKLSRGNLRESNYYRSAKRRKRKQMFQRISYIPANIFIIGLTIVLSLIGFFVFGGLVSSNYIDYLALKPSNILEGKYLWTLVTHIFVHGSVLHLFVNMFVLYSLGNLCERIIGRKRYVWFYLLSGIFAGLLSVALAGMFGYGFGEKIFGDPNVFMVGASGAIFAIAGLYVVLLPHLRFSIIFLPFFSLPAYVMIPLALFAVWAISISFGLPVGNVAHFGGFIVGLGYGFYLRKKYSRKVQLLRRMIR